MTHLSKKQIKHLLRMRPLRAFIAVGHIRNRDEIGDDKVSNSVCITTSAANQPAHYTALSPEGARAVAQAILLWADYAEQQNNEEAL